LAAQRTYPRSGRFPEQAPPTRSTVESLDRLENWRAGSAATSVVTAALLPVAVALHMRYAAVAAALLAAALLALGSHFAREVRLTALMIYPEFAHLPALARKRRRLISPRSRRALARDLRQTVACPQPPVWRGRSAVPLGCTVQPLSDRVAAVRADLLHAATELEANHDPDPTGVALIRELLRDGASPLYNPNMPPADLHTAIDRARAGLADANRISPQPSPDPPPASTTSLTRQAPTDAEPAAAKGE
jgi:hypothetical protein